MKLLPVILELAGIVVVGVGIGIELMMQAPVGAIVITAGSCLVATGAIVWAKFIRR